MTGSSQVSLAQEAHTMTAFDVTFSRVLLAYVMNVHTPIIITIFERVLRIVMYGKPNFIP